MPALTDLERKEWRRQLDYADRVWNEAGIIDNSEQSPHRDHETVPLWRFLDDYRGRQDPPFAGANLDEKDRIVSNVTFSITNTVRSILSGRDPEPIVKAKGGSLAQADAQRRARLNKIVIRQMMREQKFKREIDRALFCGMLTPFGLVRHGYTPSIEEYSDGETTHARFKNEKPDFPWLRFYRPWDVRIDPLANNFDPDQEPRWVAFRDVYTELEVKRNPTLIKRKDWRPTFEPAPYRRGHNTPGNNPDNPEAIKLFEAWTVFDANERKVFSVSAGAEKEVRAPEDWPIEWGQLPYSILTFNEQLDTPIGIPFPRLYAHEQAMFNRVWTILNAIISRTRRVVFTNKDAFAAESDQIELLTNPDSLFEFILVSGNPNEVANQIAIGQIDPTLINLLFQLRAAIREILGISEFDRGQRVNVETAAEAAQIGAGANVQKSRIQERFEGFWQNSIEVAHRALQQVKDERKLTIPLVNAESSAIFTAEEAQRGFVTPSLDELRGEFDIAVRLNSTLPLDSTTEFQKKAATYNLLGGVNSNMLDQIAVHRDIVEASENDPDAWVQNERELEAQAQQAQQGADPEGNQGANEAQGADITPLLAALGGG